MHDTSRRHGRRHGVIGHLEVNASSRTNLANQKESIIRIQNETVRPTVEAKIEG